MENVVVINEQNNINTVSNKRLSDASMKSILTNNTFIEEEKKGKRDTTLIIFNIIIGQVLALIGISNATISKVIEKDLKYVTPMLLTTSYYLLLGLFWIIVNRRLKCPKFIYIVITLFDSQANFLNVYAFSVVHFNYPFIINVSSVVWTCLFTWLFIRGYKYEKIHIVGVMIALLGVGVTLYGTLRMLDDDKAIFDNMKGLLYCLAASVLYAISAILQEIYFKSGKDIYEFFPWLGIIGFTLTFIESFALQEIYKVFYEYEFSLNLGFLWAGFSITLVVFTSIAPFFIKRCSASMFNISLVSQIFWSYLVEVITGESAPKGYEYYIGFVVIIFGIYIFNKYPIIYNSGEGESQGNTNTIENLNVNAEVDAIDKGDISLTQNLLDSENKKTRSQSLYYNDNASEHSGGSAFAVEKKYNYYRNPSLSAKANKYLNNTH